MIHINLTITLFHINGNQLKYLVEYMIDSYLYLSLPNHQT